MAKFVIAFDSEQEAQRVISRLSNAGLGDIRARILDSSEALSFPKTPGTSPMITPEMGSIEVRPSESPEVPEAMHPHEEEQESASIPTTGSSVNGVQVLIEVDDAHEQEVRNMLHTGYRSNE